MTLDPYIGPDPAEPLIGSELEDYVAFLKRQAQLQGEDPDPEWDRWLAEQNTDPSGRP